MGSEPSLGKSVSLINFILTIALAAVFFVYFTIAAYTKDAIWFWPVFDAQPGQIVIHCYGVESVLDGVSPDGQAITSMVNEQLSGDKRWGELTLRKETYDDYLNSPRMLVLELFYPEPVRVHSKSPFFSGINSLLIPLDGRYADQFIIFGLRDRKATGGSFYVETNQPLIDYLARTGLCTKP